MLQKIKTCKYTQLVSKVRAYTGKGGTLVVFAVKSMNTTSGNLVNKRRSECRTHAITIEESMDKDEKIDANHFKEYGQGRKNRRK